MISMPMLEWGIRPAAAHSRVARANRSGCPRDSPRSFGPREQRPKNCGTPNGDRLRSSRHAAVEIAHVRENHMRSSERAVAATNACSARSQYSQAVAAVVAQQIETIPPVVVYASRQIASVCSGRPISPRQRG